MTPTNDPLAVAARAARGFDVLECVECKDAIRAALMATGHGGQVITIQAAGGRDFMVCLSYDGGLRSITQNGTHVCVRVRDTAFDNLHPDGVAYDGWLRDFAAPGGVVVASVDSF